MIGTLQEVVRNMEGGVYDFTKDGKCIGCGKCCSRLLPLSEEEIQDIRRYMKKHHIKEQKNVFPTTEPMLDMTCPFLNENRTNHKCMIYDVRPYICRAFVCNQSPSKIKENKERFWKTRKPCDMRETFFGQGSN